MMSRGTHNIVIGYDIIDNLMPNGDPSAKNCVWMARCIRIVGVWRASGQNAGSSQDNFRHAVTTYMHTHGAHDKSVDIYIKAEQRPVRLNL